MKEPNLRCKTIRSDDLYQADYRVLSNRTNKGDMTSLEVISLGFGNQLGISDLFMNKPDEKQAEWEKRFREIFLNSNTLDSAHLWREEVRGKQVPMLLDFFRSELAKQRQELQQQVLIEVEGLKEDIDWKVGHAMVKNIQKSEQDIVVYNKDQTDTLIKQLYKRIEVIFSESKAGVK